MLIVRCTEKLLRGLKVKPAPAPPRSTTRLADWYATILVLRPSHLVLLVNERTRLPVALHSRELSTLATRIPGAIADMLRALGASPQVVAAELAAMAEVRFAKTENRSVLGSMNDFVHALRDSPPAGAQADLLAATMEMGRLIMSPLDYESPVDVAKRELGVARAAAPRFAPRPTTPAATPRPAARIYELKVTLREVRPAVWRRVQLFGIVPLQELHRILQAVMGWENRHLHAFVSKDRTYAKPAPEFPEWADQRRSRLVGLLQAPGDGLVYEYDFGDGWTHDVILERVLDVEPDARYPRVVGGARACPPEDCGGPSGYEHLLAALANPRHREHRELVEWVGGSFAPEAFDAAAINRVLPHGMGARAAAVRHEG
jgi:hypothetical protein